MQIIEFRAKIKDGVIQIPARFKGKVADDAVRVILVPTGESSSQSDFIDKLMTRPLKVNNFKPLRRDEIYAR